MGERATTTATRADPLARVARRLRAPLRSGADRLSGSGPGLATVGSAATGRSIDLSLNDYLGLRQDPRLQQAAVQVVEARGVGSGSARLVADGTDLFEELESRLAAFKGVEATLVYQSGYTANLGVIQAAAGRGDLVVADQLSHPSVRDGVRLSGAAGAVFPHRDVDVLERILREARARFGRRASSRGILVATDGIFSSEGDIAPLPDICEVADRFGAAVMVDDAHATGVLGRNGRGTIEHFGLEGRVDIQTGTLSKALGAVGGFVAGRQYLRDYQLQSSGPIVYSTLLPPLVAAACLAAIDVLEREPGRVDRLWANTRFLRDGLRHLGFDTGLSETPIIPVMVGDTARAALFSQRLLMEGVVVKAVVYPAVAADAARVRAIMTSERTPEELEYCLAAFGRAGSDLGLI